MTYWFLGCVCGGLLIGVFLVFTYSLMYVAHTADEKLGQQEWQIK